MTEDFQKKVLDEFKAINQKIDKMESNMATKDDITNMATKDDITNMATKDDIANMASKDDIANMATKDDIANMASKDDIANMATKDDIANMATKGDIANMATKDDIANVQADIKVLTDGQRRLRKEMDTRFTDLNAKVRKILEQTVRNSELEPTVIELKKRVEDCESDIRIVKRLITK